MGEIRVSVKLTNATDEENARNGLIDFKAVRTITLNAAVDTIAVRSKLPIQVVEKLGLGIRGHRAARFAGDRTEAVAVTAPLIFECLDRDTVEEALVLGSEVLIGQTVLEKLDLSADCNGRRLMPHPDRPNQPVSMVR